MAAGLKRFFVYSCVSRPFSKYFLLKYQCSMVRRRLLFNTASRYSNFLERNPSSAAPKLLGEWRVSRACLCQKTRNIQSSGQDDPEFIAEQVSLPFEIVKNRDDVIQNVKDKTGVIIKATLRRKDGQQRWDVMIGGTRQEVQKASYYLKSLANQDPANQRLILLQDDKTDDHTTARKEKPIWAFYRRNFKGQKPPMKTRKKCIRGKGEAQIVSGNPCPICRLQLAGEYQLDYKDVDLLAQFMSPHTGEVYEASKTGVCRYQQKNLIKAIETAKDYGLLSYTIPGPRSLPKPVQRAQIPINVRLK